MTKSGIGERAAWKDRIDQSPWIDGARWIADEGAPAEDVEYLEVEPSAYRLGGDRNAPEGGRRGSLLLGLGAGAVVLVSLAIMARPGDGDPVDQLPVDVQQQVRQRQAETDATDPQEVMTSTTVAASGRDGSGGVAGEGSGSVASADAASGPRVLSEIEPLRDDLPSDLTGVILASGSDHRLIRIDWQAGSIAEQELEATATVAPAGGLVVHGDEVFLGGRNNVLRIESSGDVEPAIAPAGRVLPSDSGVAVVVPVQPKRMVGLVGDGGEGDLTGPWSLADDVRIVGGWRDSLLVHKAGVLWSLDDNGDSVARARGELLGYDGVNLLLVNCSLVDQCRIEIGTPDQPAQRTVAVPESLAGFDVGAWTSSFALSPDGRRLALVTERGLATLLVWIDLETGEDKTLPESIEPGSPVAWSPDGRYLAATLVGDDLVIGRAEDRRTWRLTVDRPLDGVVWLAPSGS